MPHDFGSSDFVFITFSFALFQYHIVALPSSQESFSRGRKVVPALKAVGRPDLKRPMDWKERDGLIR
jgi:hypothetical protein